MKEPKEKKRKGPNYGSFDRLEIEAFILSRYINDIAEKQISAELHNILGLDGWDHTKIQNVKRAAIDEGRYQSIYKPHEGPPSYKRVEAYLKEKHRDIFDSLYAIYTAEAIDIAKLGADTLCNEIARYFECNEDVDHIHIGIAGGRTTGLMANSLVKFLSDENRWSGLVLRGKKKHIHFHSLVGFFNCADPLVEPNSLMTSLAGNIDSVSQKIELQLHMLPSPGIVTSKEYNTLTNTVNGIHLIIAALKYKWNMNVLVLSMGHWGPDHSSLFDYIDASCATISPLEKAWESTRAKLENHGVIGDIAWCPISKQGILTIDTDLKIMSMLSLQDICDIVYGKQPTSIMSKNKRSHGKSILLVSPCKSPGCQRSKGELLASLMQMPMIPATHIIADWKSIRDCGYTLK